MFVKVQTEEVNPEAETAFLRQRLNKSGALVTFCGLVRDFNQDGNIDGISLEHYPGMTEKAMTALIKEAHLRFELEEAGIVHRVGRIENSQVIVWVGCGSLHRQAAFEAATFIMDRLKQDVPLWKKEYRGGESQWVEAKQSDSDAASRWQDHR